MKKENDLEEAYKEQEKEEENRGDILRPMVYDLEGSYTVIPSDTLSVDGRLKVTVNNNEIDIYKEIQELKKEIKKLKRRKRNGSKK